MFKEKLTTLFKIEELRKKILFTLGVLAIYRIGTHIPIPGVDAKALGEFFRAQLQGTTFGLFDMFVGGALSRAAVFGVGIMPYISASIILQLLTTTVPYLERLQKEGEHGRRKIEQYTRYLTILVASIQAFGVAIFLQRLVSPTGNPVVPSPGPFFMFITILSLVAGSMLLMWLGEEINQYGIGNGISVIIFAGTLDTVPNEFFQTLTLITGGAVSVVVAFVTLVIIILTTAAVVFVTQSQRRIPIQYARRVSGRRVFGGQSTYLPLTVNTAGVIPIIFAQSIMMFPNTVTTFVRTPWAETFNNWFAPGNLLYDLLYAILIIFFAYYYTAVVLNPKDIAENLQRYSGFIPGIRAGEKTAEYIDKVMTRILLPGAIFYALVAILPWHLMKWSGIPVYFGGTRILIIVGVALELMQRMEAYLITKQYETLLQKGRLRGWRG